MNCLPGVGNEVRRVSWIPGSFLKVFAEEDEPITYLICFYYHCVQSN